MEITNWRCIRVLLSNSLIPQIREILDFRARSADAPLEGSSLISLNGFSRKPVGLLTAGY